MSRIGQSVAVAISLRVFLYAEYTAAAVLALWTVAVFPRLGPKKLRSTILVAAGAFGLLGLLPIGVTLALPHGTYFTLFGCVLPGLYLVFLFAGWTLRQVANVLGGRSGGGPGHRVPAHASR